MTAEENLILVPVNGTAVDARALDIAILMARQYHARVVALYVVVVSQQLPLDAEMTDDVARGEQILNQAEKCADQYGFPLEVELLQARAVGPALVDEALNRGARMMVMGVILRTRAGEAVAGRTITPYILKNAPCEVVICRQLQGNDSAMTPLR